MKILIENWGPLKRFEYDLSKSMIVTYGDNNIGKSYAMQVTYLLLKHLIAYSKKSVRRSGDYYFYEDDMMEKGTPVEQLVMDFARNEQSDVIDISEMLINIYAERLEKVLFPLLADSFQNTFGTYESIVEGKPKITLSIEGNIKCLFDLQTENVNLSMVRKPTRLRKTQSEFHKRRNGKEHLDIYVFQGHVSNPIRLIEEELWQIRREFSLEIVKRVKDVYFLPASRSGIYTGMSSFGPILAQLSQSRAYLRGTIQIPSISEPISDYYMQLSDIRIDGREHFPDCAEEIEKTVLKGSVIYDKKSKSIVYKPFDTELSLEMRDTSSMVSEISPITAFLKYIIHKKSVLWLQRQIGNEAKPVSVLFIEEPEAHLHPKNQVALIKAFADLSRQRVKLILASHSNYIFNQLNNLVLEKELDKNSYSPILLKRKGKKSSSVYMNIDELGVDDENFTDISEQLVEEREEIVERLMQEQWENDSLNDSNDRSGAETEKLSAPEN